jgi:hypothetical protein
MVKRVLVEMKTMRHGFSIYVGYFATCSNNLGKQEWQHIWTTFLVVLLKCPYTIFRAKTQDLAFIGCTHIWPYVGPGRGKPDVQKSGPSPARPNTHDTHQAIGPWAGP